MSATETKPIEPPSYPVDLSQYDSDNERLARMADLLTLQTGPALLEWLTCSGSGDDPCDQLHGFLRSNPSATPAQCYEWAREVGITRGTLLKIGAYAYGDGFRLVDLNSVPTGREEELVAEIKRLKDDLRSKDSLLVRLTREKRNLEDQLTHLRLTTHEAAPPIMQSRGKPGPKSTPKPAAPVPAMAGTSAADDDRD